MITLGGLADRAPGTQSRQFVGKRGDGAAPFTVAFRRHPHEVVGVGSPDDVVCSVRHVSEHAPSVATVSPRLQDREALRKRTTV
jgi:hypothetical protein